MKTKMLVSFLCSLLGVAAFGVDVSGSYQTLSLAAGESYSLTGDATVSTLDAAACTDSSRATVDLNGHALTVTAVTVGSGYTYSDSKIVLVFTNSGSGDAAELALGDASNDNAFKYQLRHINFTGNLHVTIKGGNSNDNAGLQGVSNSNTGGITFDGYAKNATTFPRINNDSALGYGDVTFKNGTKLQHTGGGNPMKFGGLIVGPDDSANVTNRFDMDNGGIAMTGAVRVAEGSVLMIQYGNSWKRFMGNLDEVKGEILFCGNGTGEFDIYQSAANATFSLRGHGVPNANGTRDRYSDVRFNKDASITLPEPLDIGMIQSFAENNNGADGEVGKYDPYLYFSPNIGGGTANLRVGATGKSGAFYGDIRKYSNNDWSVEKAGDGTWTLGGANTYGGTTTISGGTLKLTDAGRPGSGTGNLVFNGGTLAFAADATNTVANTVVAAAAPAKVHVDEGGTAVLSGSLTGATAGLEKTGAGMARFTSMKLVQSESTNGKLMIASGNTGVGEMSTWEGGLGADELMLDAGQTLDLDGRDLMVRKVSQSETVNGGSIVKNNSDQLATFTVGVGNGANANKMFAFQGNVRYVVTGNDGTHFRTGQEKMNDAVVPNTHTGGTVLSNLVNAVRIYNFTTNIGTGPLVFADGGKVFVASQTDDLFADYTAINNPIEVYGEGNYMNIEGPAWGPGFNFNGAFSGNGELYIYNGWKPYFYFNSNANDDFTGTLYLGYKYPSDQAGSLTRGFYIGEYGNGFKNATVCLKNISISSTSTDILATHLTLQQRGGDVYFGHLVTEGDASEHTDTQVIANHSAVTTLHIGAKGLSGTFSGSFVEQDGKTFAVVKEGAGTWTLDGTVASTVSGGITVNAGAIVLNTTLTGAVTVASGASFAGTVPSGGVTFASGAVFDGDEAATITGNVDLTNTVVEVDDVTAVKDGQEFLTVNGTATGKPSLSAVLAAVTARDGQTGRWAVVKATANGVTTFTLVWQRPGLIIHVR